MSKPIVIGITGGIGGGKSIFSRYLMRRGELVYDTDMEAKILQNTDDVLRAKIKTAFGDDIYGHFGLDRAKMAKIVFSNPDMLKRLTGLVHPAVIADFKRWVEENTNRKFLFMECAILFEGGFDALVDKVVVVTAPESVRIERVMRRDCICEEGVRARMQNQMDDSAKIARADWVFDTDSDDLPHLRVEEFLREIYTAYE